MQDMPAQSRRLILQLVPLGTTTRSNVSNEYAVINQDGQLFGMPAKTFSSYEAAELMLNEIEQARIRAGQRAVVAEAALEDKTLSTQARDIFTDDVRTWQQWKSQTWAIYMRAAAPWVKVELGADHG